LELENVSLPTAYLTSQKNVGAIFDAIQKGQAPPRFTMRFLESLGFASVNDRLIINVLKALGFLNDTGAPIQRYFDYLDVSRAKDVLAEGIREAYADLFVINANAQDMSQADVKNKMKTLSQGQYSESVLDKMAATFKSLSRLADFTSRERRPGAQATEAEPAPKPADVRTTEPSMPQRIAGLVYSINLYLPETRDPAVYEALFRSLKEHLLK
jgi:hypothetical protein